MSRDHKARFENICVALGLLVGTLVLLNGAMGGVL